MPNTIKKPATTKATKAKAAPAPKAQAKPDAQAIATLIASERKTASDVYAQADSAVSVPIKSLSAFKRTYKKAVSAHAIGRKPSTRQAAALAVALTAHGAKPSDGATFPRKFTMRGAQFAIENGALSDCIASGLAAYDSASETITLRNASELASQLGAINIKL